MNTVQLNGSGVTINDIVDIARGDAVIDTAPEVFDLLRKARAILEAAAAGGQSIYGMNTGLGANLKTAVESDHAAFQRQLVRGRGVAVGAGSAEGCDAGGHRRAARDAVGRRFGHLARDLSGADRHAQRPCSSADAVDRLDRRG